MKFSSLRRLSLALLLASLALLTQFVTSSNPLKHDEAPLSERDSSSSGSSSDHTSSLSQETPKDETSFDAIVRLWTDKLHLNARHVKAKGKGKVVFRNRSKFTRLRENPNKTGGLTQTRGMLRAKEAANPPPCQKAKQDQ